MYRIRDRHASAMLPHMCIAFQSFSPFTVTSTRKRSFSISLLDLAGLFYRIRTAYRIRCPFVWTPLGFTQVHPAVRQNFGTYSENSSNSGSSLSSESVISSSTRPAHPQSEHQMPSTGFTFAAFE